MYKVISSTRIPDTSVQFSQFWYFKIKIMKQSNKMIKFETYIPVTQPMFQTKYLDKNLFFKGLQMMDDTPRQMRVMSICHQRDLNTVTIMTYM